MLKLQIKTQKSQDLLFRLFKLFDTVQSAVLPGNIYWITFKMDTHYCLGTHFAQGRWEPSTGTDEK